MSQTVDVNTEPLKWPIAPDGYIPNSVIRSWRRKGRELSRTDSWDDVIFSHLHQDCTTTDEEDMSSRVFWFIMDDEEEEEEMIYDVKRRRKEREDGIRKKKEDKTDVKGKEDMKTEKDDEKNEKENKKKSEVEVKEVVDEKKDELDRSDFLKHLQTKTHLNQFKTLDDGKSKPQRQETRRTVNVLPTSSHENGPDPFRDQSEDVRPREPVEPPPHLSNPQSSSSFPPEDRPPVESPVVSAVTFVPKQGVLSTAAEPRFTTFVPTTEPQTWTPHPQEPPPSIPEDPPPQPDFDPPECSPVKDKRFLLSSAKYNNIRDQEHPPLDRRVLVLYKKFKAMNKNLAHCGKRSITQTNAGRSSPPKPHVFIQPECPSRSVSSDPAQLAQTIHYMNDQRGSEPTPEWRNTNTRRLVASVASIQPGTVAAHQRVVQKIQMKDTQQPASSRFHHVIALASQHSFFTLHPCGKTQYGRLQFDWMRGPD